MTNQFGVSFSVKYANEMGIHPKACLRAIHKDLNVKLLRLMSYWDIHEPAPGEYDFKELDWQFEMAKKYGAKVSLAIGLRQPRWPESHWPEWAKLMTQEQWKDRLYQYINVVVVRYKNHPSLISWQLENEALLKTFGQDGNFDRHRLQAELRMVKTADKKHPVIMTLSDSWGLPFRKPAPDMYAMSLYRRVHGNGKYHFSHRSPKFYKTRGKLISVLTGKPVFIHELQTEPWGPTATVALTLEEQNITMNAELLKQNVKFALNTGLLPVYLWGAEWWYWLKTEHGKTELWNTAREIFSDT